MRIPARHRDATSPDAIRALSRLAGLELPEKDLAALEQALARQLAAMERLDALELPLVGFDPDVRFDPRWDA